MKSSKSEFLFSIEQIWLNNYFFSKGLLVYDILIGTPRSSSAASAGSHNKRGNYGCAPLPRVLWGRATALWNGLRGLLDWMWERLCVSSCSKAVFFPKVISPSNYSGAVVTMVVVRNQSRRYNPTSSAPPMKVFNFLFFLAVRNINQSSEYSRRWT